MAASAGSAGRPGGNVKFVLAGLTAAAMALAPLYVAAQRYPGKSIRFIAPYAPGGSTDLLTRTLAAKLTESLGQFVWLLPSMKTITLATIRRVDVLNRELLRHDRTVECRSLWPAQI